MFARAGDKTTVKYMHKFQFCFSAIGFLARAVIVGRQHRGTCFHYRNYSSGFSNLHILFAHRGLVLDFAEVEIFARVALPDIKDVLAGGLKVSCGVVASRDENLKIRKIAIWISD